jgi:glucose/arabinose dehydrogenase
LRAAAALLGVPLAVAITLAFLGAGPGGADAQRRPPIGDGHGGVAKRKIGSFSTPTYVTHAPGAPRFLYVVERDGRVEVLHRGNVQSRPFLNINGRVSEGGERGLLSIAFDPRYRSNHLLYAYYTNNKGNIEIDSFRAASNTRLRDGSRRRVIVIGHPGESNHNGGTVQFGPDGDLYLATGDGGGTGDTHQNAQNKNELLGKVLRIKPRRHGHKRYRVPKGNPFVGTAGRNEIYALGLRNPFRFSFDRGRILIGDVGQDRFEEVDDEGRRSLRGANFGWNHFEGRHVYNGATPLVEGHYEPPIFEYSHSHGCAIIGGDVVRNRKLRSLFGRYLYTDNCAGNLKSFVPHRRDGRHNRALGIHVDFPSSIGEGARGRLYVTSLSGPVYRLVKK